MSDYFFGATDQGRQRSNNEDLFFTEVLPGGIAIAVCVIDGVGGYEGGEVAAKIAHDVVLQHLRNGNVTTPNDLAAAVLDANQQIIAAKQGAPQLEDMACVLTVVVADDAANQLFYVHVGDTRAYLFRDGSLVKLTKDQSFVGFLEDEGRLTELEAIQHPKRNEIDRALGFARHISNVGYLETGSSPFLPGDVLLLCSDGLTDMVLSAEIKDVLQSNASLKQKTARLIDAANAAGGKDNITVVLLQHRQAPQAQKALKPASSKRLKEKGRDEHIHTTASSNEPSAVQGEVLPPHRPNNSYRAIIAALSFLCVALIAIAIYFWQQNTSPPVAVEKQSITSPQAQRLSDLLVNFAGDTLAIPDSLAGTPININDTLFVQQDTLHVSGNGLTLVSDSAYGGPAFVLGEGCKVFSIDSMAFQNFSVCIAATGQRVIIKNSAFQNCPVSVQYQYTAVDSIGAARYIEDSLPPLPKKPSRK